MDYTDKIEAVKERIKQLQEINEILYGIEDTIVAIENEVSTLDSSLPDDNAIRHMASGPDKTQLLDLIDLCNQVYDIVDDILGPPDSHPSADLPAPPPARHLS